MSQNHIIMIDQEVELMNARMKKTPKLLHKSAGRESCCIFRVPHSLVDINKEAYRPRIVSIGPYHHGNKDLEMIEEHKWRFLNDLISRTGKSLEFFLKRIVSMEDKIRQSYSESTDRFSTVDLAKMMVLDGFFLIEMFRKAGKLVSYHNDDPIFRMAWVTPFLMRDILKIENQVPFFVLQELFDVSSLPNDRPLPSLILEFFNRAIDIPKRVLNDYKNLEGKHLLDFIRKSFIKEENPVDSIADGNSHSLKRIQPATKLKMAGVKFKMSREADSFLDVEFQNGTLLIPQINLDDIYGCFFMNCVVFEQCYSYCSNHFTSYCVFMGCLMSSPIDVSLLSKNRIIENCFGPDEEIAKFFKNVEKDVAYDTKNDYLVKLFMELNDYWNMWNVSVDEIKRTYFPSRWASISVFAAFLLLSLAALQTIYTVYPYYHPN
ncbi:hypothetical protein LXL04_016349 [Taraxacum kok-saghyz]